MRESKTDFNELKTITEQMLIVLKKKDLQFRIWLMILLSMKKEESLQKCKYNFPWPCQIDITELATFLCSLKKMYLFILKFLHES
uniref:Uncharacterized protein n=1 Tax=Anguilla anguilla TaxID=7936 RepID=A0A0E9WJA3_ANGAN